LTPIYFSFFAASAILTRLHRRIVFIPHLEPDYRVDN